MGSTDFSFLSLDARETVLRLYTNQGWEFPFGLRLDEREEQPHDIVLWNQEEARGAVQMFFLDPLVRQKSERTLERYTQCIQHLIRLLKADIKMKDLWTPGLRDYYAKRIEEGASPNTIGWEISTLSGIYGVLIDNKKITGITENPCRHVRGKGRGLKFSSKKRQAYWSEALVIAITSVYRISTKHPICPEWLSPMIWTSYYTGMRLGELLGLKRDHVHLTRRMIYLTPVNMKIKEQKPKRVPIHRNLAPILEKALKTTTPDNQHVFRLTDKRGTRPITKDTVELAMKRIVKALNPDPRFSFHDLRHTFRANCSRSGIPDRIAERILGHANADGNLDGELKVNQRYGEISDQEFVAAIDKYTVNNGESMIDGKPVCLVIIREKSQT
jgi:integrase